MATLDPIAPRTRIHAIDAVRGCALLGIFLVNVQSFGQPFGEFILPAPGQRETCLDKAVFYFVKTFCEGKFYPLFSMLFGMGLVLQWERARAAGRPFMGTGVRRLLVLLGLGFLHAMLLWYGDVLFMYAVAGFILLLLVGARVRTLLVVAAVTLGVAIVLSLGLGLLLHSSGGSDAPPVVGPVPHYDNPIRAWGEGFETEQMKEGPSSPLWLQTETQAYREGPYIQVFLFRASTWLMMLVIEAIGFGWSVIAMFCLGAALMKTGIFTPERRGLRRTLLAIGGLVGVPLCALAAFLPALVPTGEVVAGPITMLAGPLVSLAYLSGISLLVDSGRAGFTGRALANVGRMALTNYLLQSVIATTVFYFYGLALFGLLSRTERIGVVLGVYLVQVAWSALWLRYFAYGPMEWLWRSLTYLKPQPMRPSVSDPA